ncbi:ankyrin repeat domain-containing protein [Gelidibacter salicanalis]|nr:ankyrin repeat domain-containing protein [Gelidibacter salicanalis]
MNSPQTDTSALIEAVQKNQKEIVKYYLTNGADVNSSTSSKQSLLLLATIANNIPMAELLVAEGADVNQQDDKKDSPFLYAGAAGQLALVKLYLKSGARFDVFNRYYGSALIPACERGHTDVVRLLANTPKYPINHVNRLGWTALMEAVVLGDGSKKYVDIIQILITAGSDISIPDNDKVTALQHAKARGFHDIAKLLERASKVQN